MSSFKFLSNFWIHVLSNLCMSNAFKGKKIDLLMIAFIIAVTSNLASSVASFLEIFFIIFYEKSPVVPGKGSSHVIPVTLFGPSVIWSFSNHLQNQRRNFQIYLMYLFVIFNIRLRKGLFKRQIMLFCLGLLLSGLDRKRLLKIRETRDFKYERTTVQIIFCARPFYCYIFILITLYYRITNYYVMSVTYHV